MDIDEILISETLIDDELGQRWETIVRSPIDGMHLYLIWTKDRFMNLKTKDGDRNRLYYCRIHGDCFQAAQEKVKEIWIAGRSEGMFIGTDPRV